MLSCKMINQELEKELLEAFPDKSWDSEEVECRLTELNQALVNKGI